MSHGSLHESKYNNDNDNDTISGQVKSKYIIAIWQKECIVYNKTTKSKCHKNNKTNCMKQETQLHIKW